MNALKYGFGLILVGGFALTASCGGSSDDSSSTTGGTSSSTGGTSATGAGTTGNPSGGTFGNPSGGTSNPSGGTGNPAGGTGNPTGGTGNPTAGTGGMSTGGTGAGGATMNPAGCPATAPAIPAMNMPGEACMALATPQTACTYTMGTMTERCTCRVAFMGGGQAGAPSTDGTWRCNVGTTPIMCSATPTTGEACSGVGCALPNMGGFCRCRMGMLQCPGGMGAAGAGG